MKRLFYIFALIIFFFFSYHYNAFAADNLVTFTVTSDTANIYEKKNGSLIVIGTLAKDQTFASEDEYSNWHQFRVAGKEMYINKRDTTTQTKQKKSTHINHTAREFTLNTNVTVYDNSGSTLKQMGVLNTGSSYKSLKEYSSWISIQLSDRIGYIRKSEVSIGFTAKDSYFKALEDLNVYKKTSKGLTKVGILEEGQVYPRLKGFTDWHQIQFNQGEAYVNKDNTIPVSSSTLRNEVNQYVDSTFFVSTTKQTIIYDNTSGRLTPFAELLDNVTLSVVKEYSGWYEVNFASRKGFIKKENTKLLFSNEIDYFKANVNTGIYVKGKSGLEHIGTIKKGQVYPIEKHYSSWLAISLNGKIAYIQKSKTSPVQNSSLKNEVKHKEVSIGTIKMNKSSIVYDNTTGSLVPFATLNKSTIVNVTQAYTSWFKVEIAGRYGYINRENAIFESHFDKYLISKNIDSKQILIVESKNSSSIYATLSMYEKEGDSWRRILKTSAVLGKNGSSGNKREGDGKTPIGLYPLREAFGIKSKPSKVNYPYTKTTKDDYWVDDPTSSDYNKGITYNGDPSAKWNSFERMTNSLYQYGVIIGYNDNPIVKGKGSAIFLHVWRNSSSPTLGCVAIEETKLVNVLQNLKVEKNPHILIGTKASNPIVFTE